MRPCRRERPRRPGRTRSLSALLSQVLHAFALEYERESKASLCFGANVLRLLDGDGLGLQQLARRSGVSIEQINVAGEILARHRAVALEPDPGARGRRARLTGLGARGRDLYERLPEQIEARWSERFGVDTLTSLRSLLEALATESGGESALLWLGLGPPAGSWRSQVRRPEALPHFPMPRQSGHPDGA